MKNGFNPSVKDLNYCDNVKQCAHTFWSVGLLC